MSSCSRDTTSIKYSKMVSLFWMIVILLRMWLVRKLVKRYFHHFVSRGCTYEFIRLSTEELLRRVEEEAGNPKADIIIGGTVDAHQMMKQKPFYSCDKPTCKSYFKTVKDKDGYWYGYEVEKLAIAINKERWNEEIAPLGLSYPLRWKDLLNPVYKGKIVMPDPNVSGTAYTFFNH